jgi:hypothetical protein
MRAVRVVLTEAIILLLFGGLSGVALAEDEPVDMVGVGGRVELPEHGIALTFPDGWGWARYTGDDLGLVVNRFADLTDGPALSEKETQWLLEALDPHVTLVATPGSGVVSHLMVYPTDLSLADMAANDRQSIRDAEEAAFGQTEADITVPYVTFTAISLPAGDAYRVDWALPGAAGGRLETSDYTLLHDETAIFLAFAAPGERPPDHWLSIAESIEFLPVGELPQLPEPKEPPGAE